METIKSDHAPESDNDLEMRRLKERKKELRASINSLKKEITNLDMKSPPSSRNSQFTKLSSNHEESKSNSASRNSQSIKRYSKKKSLFKFTRDSDKSEESHTDLKEMRMSNEMLRDSISSLQKEVEDLNQNENENEEITVRKSSDGLLQQIDDKLMENTEKDERLSQLNQSLNQELMIQNKGQLLLKSAEIKSLKNEVSALKSKLKTKKSKIHKRESKILDKSKKINDLEIIINDLKMQMNEMQRHSLTQSDLLTDQHGEQLLVKEKEIDVLQEKLEKKTQKMKEWKTDFSNEHHERLSFKNQENEELMNEIKEIGDLHSSKIARKSQKNAELKQEIKEISDRLRSNEEIIKNLDEKLSEKECALKEKDAEISAKDKQIANLLEKIRKRGSMKVINQAKEEMLAQNEKMSKLNESLKSDAVTHTVEMRKLTIFVREQTAVINSLRDKLEENGKSIVAKEQQIVDLNGRIHEILCKNLSDTEKLRKDLMGNKQKQMMLKNVTINDLQYQIKQMHVNMDAVGTENTALMKQISASNERASELKQSLAQLVEESDEQRQSITEKDIELNLLTSTMDENEEAYKHNIAVIKGLNQDNINEVNTLHGQIHQMNATVTKLRTELMNSQDQNDNDKTRKLKKQMEATELSHKERLEDFSKTLNNLCIERDGLLEKIGSMKIELNREFEKNAAQKLEMEELKVLNQMESNQVRNALILKVKSMQNEILKRRESEMSQITEIERLVASNKQLNERERSGKNEQNEEIEKLQGVIRENSVISESKDGIIQKLKNKTMKIYDDAEELALKFSELRDANIAGENVMNVSQQKQNLCGDDVNLIISEMEMSLVENEALLKQIDGSVASKENVERISFDGIKNMQALNEWMMSLNDKMNVLKAKKNRNKKMKRKERNREIVCQRELKALKAKMAELLDTFDSI